MENIKIQYEVVEPILFCDNSIQKHLDNLHDIFIKYLYSELEGYDESRKWSYMETYLGIRDTLQKLKPIEEEREEYWEKRRAKNNQV